MSHNSHLNHIQHHPANQDIASHELIPVEGPNGQVYYVTQQWIMQNRNLFYVDENSQQNEVYPSQYEYAEYQQPPKPKKKKKKKRPKSCKVIKTKTKKRAKTANKKKKKKVKAKRAVVRDQDEDMILYNYHDLGFETQPRPILKSKNKKKKIKPKKKKVKKTKPKRIHFGEMEEIPEKPKKKTRANTAKSQKKKTKKKKKKPVKKKMKLRVQFETEKNQELQEALKSDEEANYGQYQDMSPPGYITGYEDFSEKQIPERQSSELNERAVMYGDLRSHEKNSVSDELGILHEDVDHEAMGTDSKLQKSDNEQNELEIPEIPSPVEQEMPEIKGLELMPPESSFRQERTQYQEQLLSSGNFIFLGIN